VDTILTLVEARIEAGQRLVVQLLRDGFPVALAFWVKTAEEGTWRLNVASQIVETIALAEAYGLLRASHERLGGIPLSMSEIRLIGSQSSLTRRVYALLASFPYSGRPARFSGQQLEEWTIDEVYVYPAYLFTADPSGPMTQDEVVHELVRLMSHDPETVPSPNVILRDGNRFTGLPFALQSRARQPMLVQFIAEGEHAPRMIGVDEIASIQ
jgi:hypothetical protein